MTRPIVLLVCAALLVAGCGGGAGGRVATSTPTRSASAGASHDGLPELTDIRQLQAAFDAHPGVPRLLILLSPT